MAQRKCSNCGHWNTDLDYCEKCGTVVSLEIQAKLEREAKNRELANRAPEPLDVIHDKIKYSKYPPVRWMYYVGRSVWAVFIAVLSFFMYAIAWAPG